MSEGVLFSRRFLNSTCMPKVHQPVPTSVKPDRSRHDFGRVAQTSFPRCAKGGKSIGLEPHTSYLYRANFEVFHLKPFSSLAFPSFQTSRYAPNPISFGDQLVTSVDISKTFLNSRDRSRVVPAFQGQCGPNGWSRSTVLIAVETWAF